jgi:hypothetical protein
VLCRITPRTLLRSAEVNMFPLLGDKGKRLDCARVGRGHVTSAVSQWRHATVEALLEAVFFRVSDRGFIEETEVHLERVLGRRQPREVRSRRRPEHVNWRLMWAVVSWVTENNSGSDNSAVQVTSWRELWREDFCVIFGVWDCGSLCVEIRC